jgi:hypothetical protein
MASARKTHAPKGKAPLEPHQYAAFIADVLAGDIAAEKLIESRNGAGKLKLEYDDPNGAQRKAKL